MEFSKNELIQDLNYLTMLSKQFPDIDAVCSEIINLKSISNLPKGTEHFLTDIHGEYEAFTHVIRNASGVIKRKINETFDDTLSSDEKRSLATLVYYPNDKLKIVKKNQIDMKPWYIKNIVYLVALCRTASSKYTRSKIRKALPDNFAYIIEELLHEKEYEENKHEYYSEIIESIINVQMADQFIIALCKVIRRLVVDRLHVLGDIYDRGPGAHMILDDMMSHHSIDVQWGNHDILWMAAASGSEACIATALRISLRYGNLETIEDGYGINLMPLAQFATATYTEPCSKIFSPKITQFSNLSVNDLPLITKMHKAISMIQFKLEGQIIQRQTNFNMTHRLFMNTINCEKKTVIIEGKTYKLEDTHFPTLDTDHPYTLTADELEVLEKLKHSFLNSEKLQKHTKFLFTKGSIYLNYNSNLLYHGCIPLDPKNEFSKFIFKNQAFSGKALLDFFDRQVRNGYYSEDRSKNDSLDLMWYLWCGEQSPLFGKSKMATFERYFIKDKTCHEEEKNPYYTQRDCLELSIKILKEFKLDATHAHIVTGHVPVKASRGENPLKAHGKMLVIDGGFSKAYHNVTGIAGYTLIYNSQGLLLVSHEPFETLNNAINEEVDNLPTTVVAMATDKRIRVKDTDIGKSFQANIYTLKKLLAAYRKGLIK